jgi:hypothetical protein
MTKRPRTSDPTYRLVTGRKDRGKARRHHHLRLGISESEILPSVGTGQRRLKDES